MILILTNKGDHHAERVSRKLVARGADVTWFDPADFPGTAALSIGFDQGRTRLTLRAPERTIDLGDASWIWYRRPGLPTARVGVSDARARELAERECRAFAQDLWSTLDGRWLPAAPAVIRGASLKASQLKTASALGFTLPPTLITNSPEELLDFYARHDGRIVSKLASPSFFDIVGDTFVRFTELVSTRDIAHAHSVAHAPMIFQAYVPKRVELRVTVVGDRVFTAEIQSQTSNRTRVDWRRYDDFSTPYGVHDLPPDVEARCLALVARLGLLYGAIDLILTPSGEYVFLEINPNGQFLWIEHHTGLPISDAICDLLVDSRAAPRVETAALGATR